MELASNSPAQARQQLGAPLEGEREGGGRERRSSQKCPRALHLLLGHLLRKLGKEGGKKCVRSRFEPAPRRKPERGRGTTRDQNQTQALGARLS